MSFFASMSETTETMKATETAEKKAPPIVDEPKHLTLFEAFDKHHAVVDEEQINRKVLEAGMAALLTQLKIPHPNYGNALLGEYALLAVISWCPSEAQQAIMTPDDMNTLYQIVLRTHKKWSDIVAKRQANKITNKLQSLFHRTI